MNLNVDKRNDIIRINRLAKTAIDIFNDILNKKSLDKKDLELIIDKIIVFEDRIHVKLKLCKFRVEAGRIAEICGSNGGV